MFYSVVLELLIEEDVFLAPFNGHFIYASLLKEIQENNNSLAEKLHSGTIKPFTVSPLMGDFQGEYRSIKLYKNNKYNLKLTILDKNIFSDIIELFLNKKIISFNINDHIFKINKICTTPLQHKYAGFISKQNLLDIKKIEDRFAIKFLSPTTFKGNKLNKFFPEPVLVFKSIKKKFDHYIDIFQDIEIFPEDIRLYRYDNLSTKVIELKNSKQICFTGQVYYEVLNKDKKKMFNILANFIKYSGVGAKTTMGLGQAIRINH